MGIDAQIAFKAQGSIELERDLPIGYEITTAREYVSSGDGKAPGATHEIRTMERYYGPGYERGSWPRLCGALMLLHACPAVEKVWYGGDCDYSIPECTVDDVLQISRHFMEHGERPYRGA